MSVGADDPRFSRAEALRLVERIGMPDMLGAQVSNPVTLLVPVLHHLLDRIDALEKTAINRPVTSD